MTPSSKTASYITSKITSRTLSLFLLPKTNRLVWYLNPPIQESHDICHGQESLIRGMVIKNPWSGIRKYRYNMNMCLCKYIHIHLHLHPTLEDPLKLLYNAVHIYKYTCICPLPLLFWHPNMTFAKTSAPSFGKEVPPWHHGKQGCTWSHPIIHRTKVECLAAKVEEMHGPKVRHLKKGVDRRLWLTIWPPRAFCLPLGITVVFFWGGWIFVVVSLRHLFREREKMHQLKIDMLNGLSDCLSFYGQDLKRKRQSKAVQKKGFKQE